MELLTAKRFTALRCSLVIGIGVIAGFLLPIPWWVFLAAGFASIVLVFFFSEKFLYLTIFLLAFAYGNISIPSGISKETYNVRIVTEGKIGEREGEYSTFTIDSPSFLKAKKVLIYTNRDITPGTVLRVKGEILPLSFPRNPGLSDRNARLKREGVIGRIKVSELTIISPPQGIDAWIARARQGVIKRSSVLFGPEAAIFSAILLGKTDLVSEELFFDMRRTGTLHLLAVSGLNVGILVAFLAFLFKLLNIPRKWSLPLLVVLLAGYVALVGPCPSIIRSSLMCVAVAIGFLLDRKTMPLNNLSIAGLAIILWKPSQILDLGFQLSFSATLSIILAVELLSHTYSRLNQPKIPKWLNQWIILPLAVSLAATIFTLPFLASQFHQITLSSVLANLPAVPLVSFVFPLGLVALLLSLIWLPLGEIIGYAVSGLLWFLENILHVLPGELLAAASWPAAVTIALFASALLLYTEKGRRYRFALSALILLAGINIGIWPWALKDSRPTLTLLDTYYGNVAVLESDGRTILLNTGSKNETVVRNYLNSRGVRTIDYVLCLSDKAGDISALDTLIKYFNISEAGLILKQKNMTVDAAVDSNEARKGLRGASQIIRIPAAGILKLPSVNIAYDLTRYSKPYYEVLSRNKKVVFTSELEKIDSNAINYLLKSNLEPNLKGVRLISKEPENGVKTEVIRETGGIRIDL